MKIVALFFTIMTFVSASSKNYVVEYFAGSELQVETRAQCKEISKALKDIQHAPKEKLKSKIYSDYQGRENQWTLSDLLQRYFLSSKEKPLVAEKLLRDRHSKSAQKEIEKILTKLADCHEFAGD